MDQPQIPSNAEIQQHIKSLEKKTNSPSVKPKPAPKPLPQAGLEHYPGEGVLYGDWGLASANPYTQDVSKYHQKHVDSYFG